MEIVAYRKNYRGAELKYWTGEIKSDGMPQETVYYAKALKFPSSKEGYLTCGKLGDEMGINGPLDHWIIGRVT